MTSVTAQRSAMRFTVTDGQTTTSFTGPGYALKMLVAACARGAGSVRELLDMASRYDAEYVRDVMTGLAVFDEHNVDGETAAIDATLQESEPDTWPPFRVCSDRTRRACTQPARAGLVVFNLEQKRIIQVQNSYSEIQRQDRGRIRDEGSPTRQLYHYKLPDDWALLP